MRVITVNGYQLQRDREGNLYRTYGQCGLKVNSQIVELVNSPEVRKIVASEAAKQLGCAGFDLCQMKLD